MNYIKRAFHSIIFYWKNALMLCVIDTVLAALILSGITIYQSCRETGNDLKEQVLAAVTVRNAKPMESDSPIGKNQLSYDRALEAMDLLPSKLSALAYSATAGTNGLKSYRSAEQSEQYPDDGQFTVCGVSSTSDYEAFQNGEITLYQGQHITDERNRNAALISTIVASQNNLTIGDYISLDTYYEGEDTQVEIVGLYDVITTKSHTGAPIKNTENIILTTTTIVFAMNGNRQIASATFKLRQADSIRASIPDLEELFSTEPDDVIKVVVDDQDYRFLSGSIHLLTTVSQIMMVSAFLMGVISLSVLAVLSLRDREFEIGVLLAMGEHRLKVILQLMIEMLVPVLIAIGISTALSSFLSREIISIFAANSSILTGTDSIAVLPLLIISLALIVIASIGTIFQILRFQPKKLLQKMG